VWRHHADEVFDEQICVSYIPFPRTFGCILSARLEPQQRAHKSWHVWRHQDEFFDEHLPKCMRLVPEDDYIREDEAVRCSVYTAAGCMRRRQSRVAGLAYNEALRHELIDPNLGMTPSVVDAAGEAASNDRARRRASSVRHDLRASVIDHKLPKRGLPR
jgi:hypothetical protein